MRILENGLYRDMTLEEIEKIQNQNQNFPEQELTLEEQVEELKEENVFLNSKLFELSTKIY